MLKGYFECRSRSAVKQKYNVEQNNMCYAQILDIPLSYVPW